MKPSANLAVTAFAVLLFASGCETDGGVSVRKQEKAATYATLKTSQKRLIDRGVIAQGFTPDMVYMAMGKPSKVETKDLPEGHAELWTYRRFYPNVTAAHGFRYATFDTQSAYQPRLSMMQTQGGYYPNDMDAPQVPRGMDRTAGESLFKTGGPEGGNMEPGDLRSYTVKVLFVSGKVVRVAANENMN